MIIEELKISRDLIKNKVAIITGAGGGIGLETAKSLLSLNAKVVIAEFDQYKVDYARSELEQNFNKTEFLVQKTDIGDASSVAELKDIVLKRFGKVDIIINNATVAPLGYVWEIPLEDWDHSYAVNLRGPVLMAKAFIPDMKKRKSGAFICVSSTGTTFLGAYETYKAAQVHLANTLADELEGTGVNALTIGPGLVMTETASRSVEIIAPRMGLSLDQFYELNKNAMISVEEAGAGFALAAVFAEKYRGQEISSMQTLTDAGYRFDTMDISQDNSSVNQEEANILMEKVYQTLKDQSDGWKQRSLFERQWIIRDFKKFAGQPIENWLAWLMEKKTAGNFISDKDIDSLETLASYYRHQEELAKGYEKDKQKLSESINQIESWIREIDQLIAMKK
jgi:NAD(P)-dependent dehydrogenase (short-subunit alcohol dehydrogenase family)